MTFENFCREIESEVRNKLSLNMMVDCISSSDCIYIKLTLKDQIFNPFLICVRKSELKNLDDDAMIYFSYENFSKDHFDRLINYFVLLGSQLEKINSRILKINSDLENTLSKIEEQENIIKSLHYQVVPIRKDEIKGVKILAKYRTGIKSGGEFFDFIKNNNA